MSRYFLMAPLVALQLAISGCINPAKVNQDSEQKAKTVVGEESCTKKVIPAVKMIQFTDDGKFCFYGKKDNLLGDGTTMALPLNTVLQNMVGRVQANVSNAKEKIKKVEQEIELTREAWAWGDINDGKVVVRQILMAVTLGQAPTLIKFLKIDPTVNRINESTHRIAMLENMRINFSQSGIDDLFDLPSSYSAEDFEIDLNKSVEDENRKLASPKDEGERVACPKSIAIAHRFEKGLEMQEKLLTH